MSDEKLRQEKQINTLLIMLNTKNVHEMCWHIEEHYYEISIPKRNGKLRTIMVPDDSLKNVQKQIAKFFKYALAIRDEKNSTIENLSFGFEKGKNIKMNADMHKNGKYFLKMDISQFFSSISFFTVLAMVKRASQNLKLNMSLASAYRMANLLCQNGVLATGSPASPVISNYLMRSFDEVMHNYLENADKKNHNRYHFKYTRYVDDITISSQKPIPEYIKEAVVVRLKKKKLSLNLDKTHFQSNKAKNIITGINVTAEGKLTVGKHKKLAIKKLLYELIKTKNIEEFAEMKNCIAGNLSYLFSVEPQYTQKLIHKYIDLSEQLSGLSESKEFLKQQAAAYESA